MRRRTLLVVLAGLAVVIVAGVVVLWPRPEPASRITVESFRRIRAGMTMAEAIAILGPPGDYTTLKIDPVPRPPQAYLGDGTVESAGSTWWTSDTAYVVVDLDKSERIVSGSSCTLRTVDHGALGNLLWRAKRQWRRWFP